MDPLPPITPPLPPMLINHSGGCGGPGGNARSEVTHTMAFTLGAKAPDTLTGQDCGALGPPPSSTEKKPDDWTDFNPGMSVTL
jgi:hypothetical protein